MTEEFWSDEEKREIACYEHDLKVRKSVEEMRIVLERNDFSTVLQKKLGREPTEDEIRLFVHYLNFSLYPPFVLTEEADAFVERILNNKKIHGCR